MRHKYLTRGIVLSRTPIGEANALVTVITPELGLVRARAQGLRRPGAKLAPALVTFAESELMLVRGKDSWRVAGAVLIENWFSKLAPAARSCAARVSGLLLRLVAGETQDARPFSVMTGFLEALCTAEAKGRDGAEVLAALRIVHALGLDAGEMPGAPEAFSPELLEEVMRKRSAYVARINHGITASGL